ncbi:MAG: site-specific integrase [Anaerovoracaceae bacterium]
MKAGFKKKKFSNIENFEFIKSQIEECDLVYPVHKSKIFKFCKVFGISDISKAGYEERAQYEKYLNSFGIKRPNSYLYAFDRIVIWQRKKKPLDVAVTPAFRYKENNIIYLVYEARKDKMDVLYDMRGGDYFVWNFAKKYPEQYKKQIADVVSSIIDSIEEKCDLRQKRRLLIVLNFLYDFLPKQGIYDLMKIDRACEKRFEMYITESYRCLRVCAKVIINLCRKVSFLESTQINWYANVWYMDRFTFDEARVNESDKIETLSFLDIENIENKKILQDYIKYLVGLTDMSLSTIRSIKYRFEEFVIFIGRKSIYDVSAYDIDEYIKERKEKGNKKQFIDRKLIIINNFYKYLLSYDIVAQLSRQKSKIFIMN